MRVDYASRDELFITPTMGAVLNLLESDQEQTREQLPEGGKYTMPGAKADSSEGAATTTDSTADGTDSSGTDSSAAGS